MMPVLTSIGCLVACLVIGGGVAYLIYVMAGGES